MKIYLTIFKEDSKAFKQKVSVLTVTTIAQSFEPGTVRI